MRALHPHPYGWGITARLIKDKSCPQDLFAAQQGDEVAAHKASDKTAQDHNAHCKACNTQACVPGFSDVCSRDHKNKIVACHDKQVGHGDDPELPRAYGPDGACKGYFGGLLIPSRKMSSRHGFLLALQTAQPGSAGLQETETR